MTSTTTIRPNDTAAPRVRSDAINRLRRLLATFVVVLSVVLALPAAAQAYPAPIQPDGGPAPVTPAPAPVSDASSSGWGLTTALGVVVIALVVVGIVVLAQRIARQRRDARPTALDA